MHSQRFIGSIAIAGFLAACPVAEENPAQAEIVPEVIVRFASDEPVSNAIAESLSRGGSISGDISTFTADLSKDVGVPVDAVRVTSGRELVLAVRPDAMLDSLERSVRASPDVAECRRVPRAGGSTRGGEELVISLEADSAAFRVLEEVEPSAGASAPALAELADSLADGLDFPVTSRRLVSGELALAIDTDVLTMRLVEALSARDDVAYAQPNFQVQYD